MRLTAAIPEAPRLLPRPTGAAKAATIAPSFTPEPVRPAQSISRSAVWTLSRETGAAAVCVQMLAGQKRGLKADAMERARYARAYCNPVQAPAGLFVTQLS